MGTLYLYLAAVLLLRRTAWAWWTLLLSGAVGFASFLTYLGYGCLDTWHSATTLVLLPVFAAGLKKTRSQMTAASTDFGSRTRDGLGAHERGWGGRCCY